MPNDPDKKADRVDLDRIIDELCEELAKANAIGLKPVKWHYRTTPYGHAIDALDENGRTLMAYPYSDPAADGNSGGIAVAWRRFEPVLRTVVYGLLLVEICIAVLLVGMYSL